MNLEDALKGLTPKQKLIVLNKVAKEELSKNLYLFTKFLGYEDIDKKVHGEIIHSLESDTKRKIICVPRGSYKSSIASIAYPIWLLIKNPNLRILIDSELYTNSATYLHAIKMHLESEKMTDIFGEFKSDIVWRDDAIVIKQRTKNLKEPSISVGGIGTKKVGLHFDYIIGDDLNSPQNSATKDQREKVISHFRYNLNILEPDGTYIIIGTRYSEDDLIGWILREVIDEPELSEGKLKQVSR